MRQFTVWEWVKDTCWLTLVVAALFAVPLLFASVKPLVAGYDAPPAVWDATYEDDPDDNDSVAQGNEHIQSNRIEVRQRLETEHVWGTSAAGEGRHLEGAARLFWEAADPANLNGTDYDPSGGAGSNALDEGRIWRDSGTGYMECRDDATAWQQCLEGIDTDVHIDGTVEWLLDGDAGHNIEIHEHGSRHLDMATAGTDGDEFDYMGAGIIRNVVYTKGGAQADYGTSAVTAVTSTSLNTSARRATGSTFIIHCVVGLDGGSTTSNAETDVWICPEATPTCASGADIDGSLVRHHLTGGLEATISIMAVEAGVTDTADMAWTCRVHTPGLTNLDIDTATIMVQDLGLD